MKIEQIRKIFSWLWLSLAILLLLLPFAVYFFPAAFNNRNPGLSSPHSVEMASNSAVQSGGLGFTVLTPSLLYWKQARNFVYLLFLFGLIVELSLWAVDEEKNIGFGTSFLKWLSALVLATFSYALAGLFIDMSFLFWYLGQGLLGIGVTGH